MPIVGFWACDAGLDTNTEPTVKSFSVNCFALTPLAVSSLARISRSLLVVVGDVRFSVSLTNPARSSPAISFGIGTASLKKQSATIVLVDPTGSLRKRIGWAVARVPIR